MHLMRSHQDLALFRLCERHLSLCIRNTGNKVLEISGKMELDAIIPCSRCLEDVRTTIHLDIFRKLDMKLSEDDRIKALDENSYIADYTLDVDGLVYDELLTVWPMKVLCREDCKGICMKCGKNLNEGDCGCDRTVLDPRMAAIRDIFRNSGN